ncbi:hypothetical protein [Longibaculum muris]|nr:hypothetical protein [Longibaculum muris]
MKKKYNVMNRYNYYGYNLLFMIVNTIMIIILYNQGYLGMVTEDFSEILKSFLGFYFDPMHIIIILLTIIPFTLYYLKKKNRDELPSTISIEIITYSCIFIPIIIILTVIELYLTLNIPGSAWLVAFVMLFSHLFIFHYIYVIKLYKYVDGVFSLGK